MILMPGATALVLAATLTAAAALLHLVVIVQGPRGYQWAGAGDRIVAAARAGRCYPAVVTTMIALVLAVWSVYALSGAGVIGPLPCLRPVLVTITSVFLLRAVIGPFVLAGNGRSKRFAWTSSAVCLLYGGMFLIGVVGRWAQLPG